MLGIGDLLHFKKIWASGRRKETRLGLHSIILENVLRLYVKINALSREWSDYRRVLDWWSDLLDSLIQRVITLYSSLLHTHAHINDNSHVFSSRYVVAVSNSGRYPSFGFPSCPRAQLPGTHSTSSLQLNPSGYKTATSNLSSLEHLGTDHIENTVCLLSLRAVA
jgi:hypothetical protein